MNHVWNLTPSEQWLCDCVQSSNPSRARDAARLLLADLGEEASFALADRNEIAPHVAHALGAAAPPLFQASHEATRLRLDAMLTELDRVGDHLLQLDVPVVALKNAGIARALYPCRGCNPMGDLDLMVRRSDFKRAHEALLTDGYAFQFRSELEKDDIDHALSQGGAEYRKQLPNGSTLWLELQWRPVAGRWIQEGQEPCSEALMERSLPIKGTKVRLLQPEDNLLQVALHTAKHSYVRAPGFRLHTDVDRIVTAEPIDWDLFMARTETARLKTAVYFSLQMAADLLRTPVPRDVLDGLRPPRWKSAVLSRWIRRAGIFDPSVRKFHRPQYLAFVCLLFDRPSDLWRGLAPPPERVLRAGEPVWWLPLRYGRRWWSLALCRHRT